MTVFEAIMLMLTFGTLIVAILCPINANRPPPSQKDAVYLS
ncbi:putative holin-like toxin [Paenibacillus taichungensis]